MKRNLELRPVSDEEIEADLRRALVGALLRQRTWTAEDLQRRMTVEQVAAALVPWRKKL